MKIDITSSLIEKGIDLAKDFLGKLIGPTIEEAGLLMKDQVTMWKFRNQITMLNKAKKLCEKNSISPKTISLKLLCPLLDYAALEEDDLLQDKWAQLLANMVDSEQNVDNHIFPYLLSQLSRTEFEVLQSICKNKQLREKKLTEELLQFKHQKPIDEKNLIEEKKGIIKEITLRKNNNIKGTTKYIPYQNLEASLSDIDGEIANLRAYEATIIHKLKKPEYVDLKLLKEYEMSNLIRLGVVKSVPITYANPKTLEIPIDPNSEFLTINFEVEIQADLDDYILTQLGEMFIKACNERQTLKKQ
jgi:hypothetical protein